MKAIVYQQYGSPEVLQLVELPIPKPKDNEVLIKTHAASVNSWDWDALIGEQFVIRVISGFFRPKKKILGFDIAGQVTAVGEKVKRFKVGDEVFGDISGYGWGGFAEYVCVPETPLTFKPPSMTFEQAAALPHAGVLALQGFRCQGGLQTGQKLLINGAGGGVGTLGLQLAKLQQAEVTVVDRADKLEMLRALGADHVIDYRKEDFTQNGKLYDFILDNVARRSIAAYKRALSPQGSFVMVGGDMNLVLSLLLYGLFSAKKMGILAHQPNSKDLDYLKGLFEAGSLVPVIDKVYPLEEVPEALRYFGEGNVKGKLVIRIH